MPERDAKQVAAGQADSPAAATIEQEILRAVARIEYGSVEVVIHDGKVVQIECREKIRVAGTMRAARPRSAKSASRRVRSAQRSSMHANQKAGGRRKQSNSET
jgi:hypothetical protein